jgi:hypothetical protein
MANTNKQLFMPSIKEDTKQWVFPNYLYLAGVFLSLYYYFFWYSRFFSSHSYDDFQYFEPEVTTYTTLLGKVLPLVCITLGLVLIASTLYRKIAALLLGLLVLFTFVYTSTTGVTFIDYLQGVLPPLVLGCLYIGTKENKLTTPLVSITRALLVLAVVLTICSLLNIQGELRYNTKFEVPALTAVICFGLAAIFDSFRTKARNIGVKIAQVILTMILAYTIGFYAFLIIEESVHPLE